MSDRLSEHEAPTRNGEDLAVSPTSINTADPTPPEAVKPSTSRSRFWCDLAAGWLVLAMVIVVAQLGSDTAKWPGDVFTDMNVLLSGENFAKHGLQ